MGEIVAPHIIGRSLHHYPVAAIVYGRANGHQGVPLPGQGGPRLYVGVDLIEIERIGLTYSRYPRRFLEKIYTPAEQAYCRGRAPQLASRFAAKEAVMKALGTGWRSGVRWVDIETRREPGEAPQVHLHGRSAEHATERGIARWHLTITHDAGIAAAFVVAESES